MISVVMPVYNGESHLKEAIDSILNQTYSDFEFLIINDGSTDGSEDIILSYQDDRIKYILNEANLGIVKTLNKGIVLASNKYIARMDADDISMPHRFERQLAYMEANPDIAACGSNILKFYNDDLKQTKSSNVKTEEKELKIRAIFYTAFWHPTMLLRTKILKDHHLRYRLDYKYAQDKALWIDISKHGALTNVKEPLLYYRVHENQVSTKFFAEQYAISMAITREALLNLGVDMRGISNKIVGFIAYPQRCDDVSELYMVDIFISNVIQAISPNQHFDIGTFKHFMKIRLMKTLFKSHHIGVPIFSYIYKSKFLQLSDFDIKYFIKVILKRNTKKSIK